MSDFPDNDWRDYLMHAWAQDPQGKIREKAYNANYYQEHKDKILARALARYARFGKKRGNGAVAPGGDDSGSGSGKKGKGSSKKSSSKEKTKEAASTKIDDDAPDWLKNYAAEIDKVRNSSGNASWVPSHVNDFDAWANELKKAYPDLNLSGSAAKEVWGTINQKFGDGSSKKSSGKKTSTKSSSKSSTKEKSSKKKASEETTSDEETKVTNETTSDEETKVTNNESRDTHDTNETTPTPKMSEKNKKVFDELVENYRKGAAGEIDAYKDDGEYVSAYDDYDEWQAEMYELGADDSDFTKENWEEFKKTRKAKR